MMSLNKTYFHEYRDFCHFLLRKHYFVMAKTQIPRILKSP
ncbi:hypothetical protein M2103_001789 [Ereboglobus sp. PH5-5]|nr:hypothetical protein [Ereboglobus sp. PH5-5]